VRAGAAAGDDLGRQALGAQSVEVRSQAGPLLGRLRLAVGVPGHVLEMAIISLEAAVAELRESFDPPRQADRVFGERHAGPALAHVDLDQHAERSPGPHVRGQGLDSDLAVDHHGQVAGAIVGAGEPLDHAGRNDGRGDQNALEASVGHHLGLTHGRAAEADCARLELAAPDRGALVRLDVGSHLAAVSPRQLHHGREVVLESVGVEQQAGRRQPRLGVARADQRFVRSQRHRLILRSSAARPQTVGA
jgi:hypothetical protein